MGTSESLTLRSKKRKKILLIATLLFALMLIAFGIYYAEVLSEQEETDDAYVGGNLVTVSSQVSGTVKEIRAEETQKVEAGTEIITLDSVDADVALRLAEARLGEVVLQLKASYASVAQYDSMIKERSINLKKAKDDLARRLPLAADHTVPEEDVIHARQAVEEARASLDVTLKQQETVKKGLGSTSIVKNPSLLAAKADYIQAWLTRRRITIPAPVAGYVAKRSVQVGGHVTPGMALLSIVPLDQLWVDANFKESQLTNIRVGQPATLKADIYGGKVEYHGKVAGLSAGTGSAFSLLPAQNATGNWVKVVQRLAVRISLDLKELSIHPLRIGLSTVVTVDTHVRSGTVLGSPIPAEAIYATNALDQPMHDAESAADRIIEKNLGH
jgi:membrane fusion protein, multidrug efflux system